MHMVEPNYSGHNMVFIVGCPRSGTTWLQRLLACHPKVRTGQESLIFEINIGPQLRQWRKGLDLKLRGGVGLGCYFTEDEFHEVLKSFLITLLQPMIQDLGPDEIFVEKTPSHVLFIPEIIELLPKCRIIHMLRDPRDVVASLISASQSWGSSWAPKSARSAARVWMNHVLAAQEAKRNLQPWQFHEIRYEHLASSTNEILKQCATFLGLEWSNGEIAKAIEANKVDTAGGTFNGTAIPLRGEAARRNGPVITEPHGFFRKATAGSWKTDLTTFDKIRIWRLARHLMADLDYQWPLWTSS
jgi:hypothetical protein